jgi:pyruvate/2-oxoglutarate dehydrogenase complex dihydrolipoamide acyltransferase (E2) component
MRSTIARHMKHSQESAATCTSWIEVDMTNVERFRRTLGLTAMPFIAEAATGALRDHPSLNAWLEGPDESLQHTIHEEVNLGIAVSLGKGGLIVPVIHRAQELSVTGLAARIRDLGSRGRAGQLSPDEMLGGTFTISNAGRVGGFISTPIINQPQVAILGVEGIAKRPVVVSAPDGADAIAIRSILVLGMTWDHRAMDGITANEFLAAVKQRLEAVAPKPTAAEEKR